MSGAAHKTYTHSSINIYTSIRKYMYIPLKYSTRKHSLGRSCIRVYIIFSLTIMTLPTRFRYVYLGVDKAIVDRHSLALMRYKHYYLSLSETPLESLWTAL